MKVFRLALPLILLMGLIYTFNRQISIQIGGETIILPPIGKFVDPESGFWANAEIELSESNELSLEGFKGNASVYFDERRVPHIFAENEYDLYFAQGYVVARDRLFQMELQTLDASGRLAEKLGKEH